MAASLSGAPFTNVDPETAKYMRSKGLDPHELDRSMENILSNLRQPPAPPVSATALLSARFRGGGGVDRISGLPDALLRDIVSRLPVKDAARTAALAARWRGVWRSAPLVLADVFLLSDGPNLPPSADTRAAVSRVFASHPGPFRCVHLLCSRMGGAHQAELTRWLRLLAARGVQELVLVNRPWPREVPLPTTLFTISTLTRLYIGVWKFPDVSGLRGVSFPNLRELGICSVELKDGDIDAVVARSPALEILNIAGNFKAVNLRLVSNSLRCVQVCASVMKSIAVVNAPRLERLILGNAVHPDGALCTRLKIRNAPKLRLFGYLEPGKHALEINDTVIMAGVEVRASMMLTTVKVLGLRVHFGVQNDINMVATFLRCFPNVEALHIASEKCDQPTGKLNLKFWEDQAGPIVSVLLRIGVMTFSAFRGEQYELSFLQYFFESARMLKYAVIAMENHIFTSLSADEMFDTVKNMNRTKWATNFDLAVMGRMIPREEHSGPFSREQILVMETLLHQLKS
ncbi:LOW QUALITY PROTEIN: putative FBD-associated F-box protein At3g50710 [Brachypodium distachyon]|uniref:LOW QUALITY PROTEIN: putative FBD-associated F-box protein At3g50710 n=1 Tax=Brachypodium distachyon TaxID=15368 RepID=UPI000D0E2041|nr:LOW QUALITY PROTEIN: putative FBD-associated F-box protein At3g50710 [Brachypodium distachyon]|eukprot:XP_024317503.1 LOW QUALITY PROTEIN: putative FBD-associated F-box protein At3g50710 [Brachypodium distachyon]